MTQVWGEILILFLLPWTKPTSNEMNLHQMTAHQPMAPNCLSMVTLYTSLARLVLLRTTQTDDNKPPESIHKPTDGTVVDKTHDDSPLPISVHGDQEETATGDAESPIPTDISYPTADDSSNTKHSNVIKDCYESTSLGSIEYCNEPDGRTCHHPSDAIKSITFEIGPGTPSKLKAYCPPPTTPDTVLTSQEASMGSEQEATLLPRRNVVLSGVVSTLFDNPQALEPCATTTLPQRDVRTPRRRALSLPCDHPSDAIE